MSAEPMKINDRRAMTVLAEQETAVAQMAVSPMQMLAQAFQRGMPVETIRELRQIQKEWEADEARKAFDAAVADAKAEIKPILKNREVDFTSKNGGGRTNYEYEDFGAIAEHVDPIISKYGLSYRHRPKQEGKMLTITCILSHRAGHREETSLSAPNDESGNKNGIQGIGSTATFLQRYTLRLALGLATTRDDDGQGASDPGTTTKPTAPADYKDWQTHMETTAKSGTTKLQEAWNKTAQELRDFASQHDVTWWKNTKATAAKVQS